MDDAPLVAPSFLDESSGRGEIDGERLRSAVASGNIPTLLMVLFQLTGDERWLEPPFSPTTTRGLGDHDDGGLPEVIQDQIREAVVQAALDWAAGAPPAVPTPRGHVLQQMMSVCMGEPVPDVYARVMEVEMGFLAAPVRAVEPGAAVAAGHSVIVIGAGVSGLCAAVRLREAGIPFEIIEKNDRVGGTWFENTYPGAGVDTPSYLYSFSFFPRNWSTHFGKRDEVHAYIEEMVDHFDLRRSIRFETEVLSADWDDTVKQWRVEVRGPDGVEVISARSVVTAVGLLNRPKVPDLSGMDDFQGPIFHSARWPDGLDVSGRRVAVVGTGASAMQIVPAISERVEELTVFQRSPQWAAPCEKYFLPVGEHVHWLMEHVPYYHRWYRFRLGWAFNDKIHDSLQIDPDWEHPERSLNAVNDAHRRFFTRYLQEQLEGREDLQQKALPEYPPYGKRMLLDNGWYAALRRPNVELVTEAVAAVTETGLVTESGATFDTDVIVLCTGFEAQRQLYPMEIRGRGGESLREVWGDDDARAYLGITTPDFPNLFFLYGPNTNPGGGSYIFIAESQTRYVVDLLVQMIEHDVDAVECRPEVHDQYNERIDEAHSRMIWTHPGMSTYYRNEKGRVVTNSPWRVVDYWEMTRAANLDDYLTSRANAERPEVSSVVPLDV